MTLYRRTNSGFRQRTPHTWLARSTAGGRPPSPVTMDAAPAAAAAAADADGGDAGWRQTAVTVAYKLAPALRPLDHASLMEHTGQRQRHDMTSGEDLSLSVYLCG